MSKKAEGRGTQGRSEEAPLLALLQQFTLETDRFVDALSTRHHLHRTDLNALAAVIALAKIGIPATPGRLGEALNLSSPATTALIDRLNRAGHLRRKRSEVDRRQVHLEVTPLAEETGREMFSPLSGHLGAVIRSYSADEQAVLERFMTEIVAATIAARESASETPGSGPPG